MKYSSHLYDLYECLWCSFCQQGQTESTVQFSDTRGQEEGERSVRCARRRSIFSRGQELTRAVQDGWQNLERARTNLRHKAMGEKRQMRTGSCVLDGKESYGTHAVHLGWGVFEYNCEQSERRWPPHRRVRDEGRPVSIQGSLFYTFDHTEQRVQSSLTYKT